MNPRPSTLNPLSRVRGDRPSVHLHIERLVLDGLPVSHHQGSFVQAAIETELTRLLAEVSLSQLSGGAAPHLSGGSIQVATDSQPAHLGHQIANAIYSSIRPNPVPLRPSTEAALPRAGQAARIGDHSAD